MSNDSYLYADLKNKLWFLYNLVGIKGDILLFQVWKMWLSGSLDTFIDIDFKHVWSCTLYNKRLQNIALFNLNNDTSRWFCQAFHALWNATHEDISL